MTGIMLTASQARAKSRNDLIIFNEIRAIELSILTAAGDGDLSVEITGTLMTSTTDDIATAREYFRAWQGSLPNRAKEQQMANIVEYFYGLGYQIDRRVNGSTGDTFKWVVYW
jgi:hypothetical protein